MFLKIDVDKWKLLVKIDSQTFNFFVKWISSSV